MIIFGKIEEKFIKYVLSGFKNVKSLNEGVGDKW